MYLFGFYDWSMRSTIGEIMLNISIGLMYFTIMFHVIDTHTFYNSLSGGQWIHMAWAVPSTLHQVVKLEYKHKEIIIHREDGLPTYKFPPTPYIEAKERCDFGVY